MNKTYTVSEKAEKLIDFLADKTLSLGCEGIHYKGLHRKKKKELCNTEKFIVIKENGTFVSIVYGGERLEVGLTTLFFKNCEIIGRPAIIGDVLYGWQPGQWSKTTEFEGMCMSWSDALIQVWDTCGITKSLNEIFSGEIIKESDYLEKYGDGANPIAVDEYKFVNSDVQSLLDFLWELFKKEITKQS